MTAPLGRGQLGTPSPVVLGAAQDQHLVPEHPWGDVCRDGAVAASAAHAGWGCRGGPQDRAENRGLCWGGYKGTTGG